MRAIALGWLYSSGGSTPTVNWACECIRTWPWRRREGRWGQHASDDAALSAVAGLAGPIVGANSFAHGWAACCGSPALLRQAQHRPGRCGAGMGFGLGLAVIRVNSRPQGKPGAFGSGFHNGELIRPWQRPSRENIRVDAMWRGPPRRPGLCDGASGADVPERFMNFR